MKRLTAFLLAVIVMMPLLLTSCWWQEDFEYELTEDGTGCDQYGTMEAWLSWTDAVISLCSTER